MQARRALLELGGLGLNPLDHQLNLARALATQAAQLMQLVGVQAPHFAETTRELLLELLRTQPRGLGQVVAAPWQQAFGQGVFEGLQAALNQPLGARKAFIELCARLRELIEQAQQRNDEVHALLVASFSRLNAEFGFSLVADVPLDVRKYTDDLNLIERNYVQYLGLSQAFRLAQPGFQEQFRRMLISRLRVVFETISNDIELWNKTASAQVDSQLRERRRNFKRRYESLDRIQSASSELDTRLQEVQAQDERVLQLQTRLQTLMDQLGEVAGPEARAPSGLDLAMPSAAAIEVLSLDLSLDSERDVATG